ncbi:hypothetical protein Tco_0338050, partial [Tanacetum coccineum]
DNFLSFILVMRLVLVVAMVVVVGSFPLPLVLHGFSSFVSHLLAIQLLSHTDGFSNLSRLRGNNISLNVVGQSLNVSLNLLLLRRHYVRA